MFINNSLDLDFKKNLPIEKKSTKKIYLAKEREMTS